MGGGQCGGRSGWGGPHPGVTSQVCSLRRAGDALDQAPGLPEAGGGGSEPEPNPPGTGRSRGEEQGVGKAQVGSGPVPPHRGVVGRRQRSLPVTGLAQPGPGSLGRGVSSIRGQGEGAQPRVTGWPGAFSGGQGEGRSAGPHAAPSGTRLGAQGSQGGAQRVGPPWFPLKQIPPPPA